MFVSLPFLKVMFKEQCNNLFKISSAIVFYEGLLTLVYPAISRTPALSDIVESIPSTVKTVFGVANDARTDTFEAYISSQFFARIWTIAMAAYGISAANSLLAKLIDDGSLAFPLATPTSRCKILYTQSMVLLLNNSFLTGITFIGILLGAKIFNIKIVVKHYLGLGLLSLAFFSVITSYAFLFSTLLEKEKSSAYAYGLTFIFYVLDVMAGLSDKWKWTENLSLFKLFKPQEVLEGSLDPTGKTIGLGVGACLLMYIAFLIFDNRDLPL